jgi:penicillin-binding protein 1A
VEFYLEKKPEKSGLFKRLGRFCRLFCFIASLILVITSGLAIGLYGLYRNDIPEVLAVKDFRPKLKSKVFAQNGELIAELGVIERIVVNKDDLPLLLIRAFIAAEDKNFYHHHGIDGVSIIKALAQSILFDRATLRGASTITQQLAKGLLVKKEGFDEGTKRTLARKIKEAILARRLERNLSKDDILWIYLNDVYLGDGSYGVAAAARNYFDKDLKDLSLGEIALLAGLPQAPSRFSPRINLSASLARQAYVLERMEEDEYISHSMRKEALERNKDLTIHERANTFRRVAPYFSETVRRKLMDEFGEDLVYQGGLNVYTTLNIDHERAMQETLKFGLIQTDKRQGFLSPIFRPADDLQQNNSKNLVFSINQKDLLNLGPDFRLAVVETIDTQNQAIAIDTGDNKGIIPLSAMSWARKRDAKISFESARLESVLGPLKMHDVILVKKGPLNDGRYSLEQEPAIEGAMVAIEPSSGYVTAMQGGYAFDKSEFNRIYQACRQPGSLFKPVVYSAAIALKNYTPATMVMDEPLVFTNEGSEKMWEPQNFDRSYKGSVTVREALMMSMNIPTINIMADVGLRNVFKFAKKLGITTKLKSELGTAIGSSCVTPIELAKAFLVIANMGVRVEPVLTREITDRDHKRLRFDASKNDPWIMRDDRINVSIDDFFAPKKRVMAVEDAYTMHYLLSEAAHHGTAQKTSVLGRHIAAKTGTTNDSFDAWFAGYSKTLMTLVWVGNDMMEVPLGVSEQGARTALPFFNQFMGRALAHIPDQDWDMPKTMCQAFIDPSNGKGVLADDTAAVMAPFKCGQEPQTSDW